MGSHRNRSGTLKRAHETKESAELHLIEIQPNRIHAMQVYKCPQCKLWHVGRIPGTLNSRRPARTLRKHEDLMIGKLIGILRGTYPGPPRIRKAKS